MKHPQEKSKTGSLPLKPFSFQEGILQPAKILKRKSQFTVEIQRESIDTPEMAHWPVTSTIENVDITGLPCLLALAPSTSQRKTSGTIEAIGVGKEPLWLGINQNRANRVVEHFLGTGQLEMIVPYGEEIQPEFTYGEARFDFKIGEKTFIEVKTPLHFLSLSQELDETLPRKKKSSVRNESDWGERITKHFRELTKSIEEGYRIILLDCFLYPAVPFVFGQIPAEVTNETERKAIQKVIDAEYAARQAGLEMFQLTSHCNPSEITFESCFPAHYAIS